MVTFFLQAQFFSSIVPRFYPPVVRSRIRAGWLLAQCVAVLPGTVAHLRQLHGIGPSFESSTPAVCGSALSCASGWVKVHAVQ